MLKNLNLYRSIINTDFFLLNLQQKYNLKKNLNNKKIKILDILDLVKQIKQFIRLLQFIKRSKQNSLLVKVYNKVTLSIFKRFFLKYPVNFPIQFRDLSFLKTNKTFCKKKKKSIQMLILITDFLNLRDLRNFTKKQFLQNFFLIQNIDKSKFSSFISMFGNYKIHNDLLDLKKIILISIIINKIFKKIK
jgi:hypothetical protein